MPIFHKLTGSTIALVAVGAALISASTIWGGYPLGGGVPITLQTLAILLVAAVLGAYRGAAAVLIYLAIGTAGVKVFSGHTGGTGIWTSPRAGFLVSFVVAAFLTGWIVERLAAKRQATVAGFIGATLLGALVIIALGWSYFAYNSKTSFNDTFAILVPYTPGDVIKAVIAAAVAVAVYRAYPQILAPAKAAPVAAAPVATAPAPVVKKAAPAAKKAAPAAKKAAPASKK